jgi:hypothetical protein
MAVLRLDQVAKSPVGTGKPVTRPVAVKSASPFPWLRRGACRAMSAGRGDDQA